MKHLTGKTTLQLKHGSQIVIYRFKDTFVDEGFESVLLDKQGNRHERIELTFSFDDSKLQVTLLTDEFTEDEEEYLEIVKKYEGLTPKELFEIGEKKTINKTLQIVENDKNVAKEGSFQLKDVETNEVVYRTFFKKDGKSMLFCLGRLDVLDELTVLDIEGLPINKNSYAFMGSSYDIYRRLFEAIRIYASMKHGMKVDLTMNEQEGEVLGKDVLHRIVLPIKINHFIENIGSENIEMSLTSDITISGHIDSSTKEDTLIIKVSSDKEEVNHSY